MPLSAAEKKNAIETLNTLISEPLELIQQNDTPAKVATRALPQAEQDFACHALLFFHLKEAGQPIPTWLNKAMAEA